jgi:hypothetical protein
LSKIFKIFSYKPKRSISAAILAFSSSVISAGVKEVGATIVGAGLSKFIPPSLSAYTTDATGFLGQVIEIAI